MISQLTNGKFEKPTVKRMYFYITIPRLAKVYIFFIGAVYRYYESRRRQHLDSGPNRRAAAAANKVKTRKGLEQKRVSLIGFTSVIVLLTSFVLFIAV